MTTPAYQNIKDFILSRVASGEWREGDLVPSENELAKQFSVARMTVNRAIRELTADQVLIRVKGAGTFVAQPKYQSTLVEIKSIAEEITARGHQHSAVVLKLDAVVLDESLAREMQMKAKQPVFHSVLLHLENGTPIQLEERWVNPKVAPDYAAQDFTQTTPNEYLVHVAPLQKVEYRIEARSPDSGTRSALKMESGEPCLMLHRRTFSQGEVASVANLWHPGSRYQFTGHF
ncbi:histidine utilization repressor [Leeia sp. TBRC 13508]|uniref:Histidine utilization repressor n=1 Tax=Leeia speluncae TaxID=2884804 RepID=A0ABS8D5Z6_9NEIS|nr:histidine utilization repressor [Leeia speluncae]MCB6183629.1 histidine utilization repressor [Leeia speluncae]